jgi:hypothetical protein
MPVLKIIAITLLLIAGPVLLESCCFNDCCGTEGIYYNIEDISLTTTPYPAVPPYPSLSEDAVKLSTVAFYFNFELKYLSFAGRGGFQTLACDPVTESKQTISSIDITSSGEVGGISAGQPLNDLFEAFKYDGAETGMPIEDIYGDKFLPNLWFRTPAEVGATTSSSFTFRVALDDGRLFVLTTDQISLVP